jgi:hypothetical protein
MAAKAGLSLIEYYLVLPNKIINMGTTQQGANMSCRHYHLSTKSLAQIGGPRIEMPVHRCNILETSQTAGINVQLVLMPLNLCGSIIPTQCPIATHHSTEWSKCPFFESGQA